MCSALKRIVIICCIGSSFSLPLFLPPFPILETVTVANAKKGNGDLSPLASAAQRAARKEGGRPYITREFLKAEEGRFRGRSKNDEFVYLLCHDFPDRQRRVTLH